MAGSILKTITSLVGWCVGGPCSVVMTILTHVAMTGYDVYLGEYIIYVKLGCYHEP